ncbi:MAG: glycosyltransferase family 4 protein [Rubripirellula sp.]
MLREAGHEVHLIHTFQQPGLLLPACTPDDVPTHLLTDGRNRGKTGVAFKQKGGYRPLAIFKLLGSLKAKAKELDLDVVHFFGFERTVAMAGMVKLMGLSCPTVATVYRRPKGKLWKKLARFAGPLISSTQFVCDGWANLGHQTTLARHGVVRDLYEEIRSEGHLNAKRSRVLFWRILTHSTGGDLVIEAFDKLAPEFPELTFDFALRPNAKEQTEIVDALAARHPNVNIFRFPYPEGVSLAKLVAESLIAVFPFRELTIEPQLAIAETLDAGTACLTSNHYSLPELTIEGETGALVGTENAEQLTGKLRELLQDQTKLLAMSAAARETFQETWNWDSYLDQLHAAYAKVVPEISADNRAATN